MTTGSNILELTAVSFQFSYEGQVKIGAEIFYPHLLRKVYNVPSPCPSPSRGEGTNISDCLLEIRHCLVFGFWNLIIILYVCLIILIRIFLFFLPAVHPQHQLRNHRPDQSSHHHPAEHRKANRNHVPLRQVPSHSGR